MMVTTADRSPSPRRSPGRSPGRRPGRPGWAQPGFLVAAGILAFSAVGLNVAVSKLQLHFKKLPVYPVQDLSTIPKQLGPWAQVSIDEPLASTTSRTRWRRTCT